MRSGGESSPVSCRLHSGLRRGRWCSAVCSRTCASPPCRPPVRQATTSSAQGSAPRRPRRQSPRPSVCWPTQPSTCTPAPTAMPARPATAAPYAIAVPSSLFSPFRMHRATPPPIDTLGIGQALHTLSTGLVYNRCWGCCAGLLAAAPDCCAGDCCPIDPNGGINALTGIMSCRLLTRNNPHSRPGWRAPVCPRFQWAAH